MLYSFDIFDTLLTRSVATPTGIFSLMQEQLKNMPELQLPELLKNYFAVIRVQCEWAARRILCRKGREDIRLRDIYTAMVKYNGLPEECIEPLLLLEKKTEYENSIPIRKNIALLEKLVGQGERVVLISDMYLLAEEVRSVLVKASAVFSELPIYISGEWEKTKGTGSLFELVREKEGADFSDWTHYGDNKKADYKMPRSLGIKAVLLPFAKLEPLEETFIGQYGNQLSYQLNIGAARNMRLEYADSIRHDILAGASFAGPVLFAYVSWVLAESQRKGIRRLYFVARDGFVLKALADIIIARDGLEIETKYIYGSRKVWRLPADIEDGVVKYLVYRMGVNEIKTIADLAAALTITESELRLYLGKNFSEIDYEVERIALKLYVEFLNQDEEFKAFLFPQLREKHRRIAAYFQQEIDFHDDNYAFVELYGTGLTQLCLGKTMQKYCDITMRTFFFSIVYELWSELDAKMQLWEFCSFKERQWLNIAYFLEAMCRSVEAKTVDYEYRDGRWRPVFAGSEDEGLLLAEYGYGDYVQAMRTFCRNLCCADKLDNSLQLVLAYYGSIYNGKASDMLVYFSEMPYVANNITGKVCKFAPLPPAEDRRYLRRLFLTEEGYEGNCIGLTACRLTGKSRERALFYLENKYKLLSRYLRLWKKPLNGKIRKSTFDGVPVRKIFGKRIVVYGAGKFGRRIFSEMGKIDDIAVVAWLDANFAELSQAGIGVTGTMEALRQLEFDTVFIAILNADTVREVKLAMHELEVPEHKITALTELTDLSAWVN